MQWGKRQLAGEYEFILWSDPALDNTVADFEDRYDRYRDTGDVSHLPIRPGAQPVVFVLRHLFGAAEEIIEEERQAVTTNKAAEQVPRVRLLYYKCAQFGLVRARGLANPEGAGEFQVQTDTCPRSGHLRVTEHCMGQLQRLEDATGVKGSAVSRIGEEVFRRLYHVPLSSKASDSPPG